MNLSKLEDKDLISLYINGQEKAFEVLLNRHKNKIYNYIYMIDHFRKTSKVRVISESSSRYEDFTIFDLLEVQDNNVEDDMIYSELVSQMVELIEHLPDAQRDILNMRIFKEMSFKDIAKKENVSINTALGRMRYALINIRKLIEKHNLVTPLS